jgi:hypothetical protein
MNAPFNPAASRVRFHEDLPGLRRVARGSAAACSPRVRDEADHHADAQGGEQRQGARAPLRTARPAHHRLCRAAATSATTCCAATMTRSRRASSTPSIRRGAGQDGRLHHERQVGLHDRLFARRLVGADGLIECKSRRQKFQVQTIIENVGAETIPAEFMIQVQTGLARQRAHSGAISSATAAACRWRSSASTPDPIRAGCHHRRRSSEFERGWPRSWPLS